jgi:hypothetical protein
VGCGCIRDPWLPRRERTQTSLSARTDTHVDFLLATGALVGLLWMGVVFLRGGPIGGALLVLLAGSCFGFFFYHVPLGPVPLTVDRLLLGVLLVQYLVYRHWGWIEPKPLAGVDYLLGAFLLVLVVSTVTHDFQYRGAQPLSQLVFFYLIPAVMYWVARQTELTERSVGWLLSSLAVFGVYLCVTAIAETHQVWALVFPQYIGSTEYREFLGRGRGPLLNPAGNGILQALGMCAALVFWPRSNRVGKLLLLAALPVFAWGVYSTLTRSVWMGAGLGLMVVVGLTTPRSWRAVVLGGAVLSAVVVSAVNWEHLVAFKRDQDVSVEDVADSAKLRPVLAVIAWHMFLDRPLLGCGYGQYIQESPNYLSDRSTDLPLEKARPYVQHNVFLALLTETGLLGMGLFVALLTAWARIAWRLWNTDSAPPWVRQIGLLFLALLGVYLPNAMFHDLSLIPMINMVLFFLGGATAGLAHYLACAKSEARLKLWMPEPELAAGSH